MSLRASRGKFAFPAETSIVREDSRRHETSTIKISNFIYDSFIFLKDLLFRHSQDSL